MKTYSLQAGFTLIEVLVALTLMALMSALAWRGLDAVAGLSQRIEQNSENIIRPLRVLDQWERDVQMAAPVAVMNRPALAILGVETKQASESVLPEGMIWAETGDTVTAGLHIIRDAGGGNWQHIHWYIQQGQLFRAQGAASASWPLPLAQTSQRLMQGLAGMTLHAWIPGQGWQAASTQIHRLGQTPARQQRAPIRATGLMLELHRADDSSFLRKVVVLP